MEKFASKKGTSVYAYQGDAMTLLAFDLDESLTENFAGFTIKVNVEKRSYYIYNRMKFDDTITLHREPKSDSERLSTEFSPIQKFRWIHVPSTDHFIDNPYFGEYTYEVCPRYIVDGKLLPPDKEKTASVSIEVCPFKDGKVAVGFTRSFISSQAFAYHFGNNLNLRPNQNDLTYEITDIAGDFKRYNSKTKKEENIVFTYEDIHEYLGWQARDRIMEFLDEVMNNKDLKLDVFAYDLNEPLVVEKLIELGIQGRVRIILDDYPNHKETGCFEMKFETAFNTAVGNEDLLKRGHFSSQAHSKVFIQRKNNSAGKAVKVLTGSTNFSTNGLYINANHVLIFNDDTVAQVYADIFDASFGKEKMKAFKTSDLADSDFDFSGDGIPEMTIRFAPHPVEFADYMFEKISGRILDAKSDVLFAVMADDSKSTILDALKTQVKSDDIFTYGITDKKDELQLYKPESKKGVKISALNITTKLRKPFTDIIGVPGLGHLIHHKFVVVDFKGKNPVVYCGSSNLAYDPEQKNGDNLLEIRDKDVVTVFAIEAIRLVDHYQWLNKGIEEGKEDEELFLHNGTEKVKWYKKYYNPKDLRFVERVLLMR